MCKNILINFSFLLLLTLSACGGGSDGPELGIVTGTVTLNEQPVSGALVSFVPNATKNTTGPASTATTDAGGKFTLKAPGNRDGAVIGFHRVGVQCPGVVGVNVSTPDGGSGSATDNCKVPAKYTDPNKSGITVEIKSGENDIPIKLSSKK
ncbi:hypothetical protein [uncultured Gimesia sp.]|uniref:hypothetical protein n=1 Tax=uncultured Gimesia sp. TaxID=1678688 RepID=UPI0030DC157C|tara:strand:- start:21611 stop:22063 length:453 start_codon:yes stop_codon:yes gene_type:complete